MANLLQKASIVLTPTAYDDGKVLCAKPSEPPYGDFDFSRNSAATRVNAQGLVENVQILSSNLVQNGDFSEEGVQEISNGSFSQEGSELTTNGDFSNGITGWTTSGGNPTTVLNGTATVPNGSYIFQSSGIPASTQVKLVVEGTGKIRYRLGTAEGYSGQIDMPFTLYVPTQSSGTRVQLQNSSGGDVTITNVSLKEVGQDWDLSSSNISIGEDKLVCNNVLQNNAIATQVNVIPVQKQVKVQFDIVVNSGSFRMLVGSGGTTTIVTTSGTYTFYETSGTGGNLNLQARAGGFDGSITNISVKEVLQDWTAISSSALSIDNGALKISNVTQGYGKAGQSFSTISGKTYKIKFDGFVGTAAQFQYRLGTTEANTNIAIQAYSTNQTIEAQFIALSSLTYLTFVTQSAATGVYTNIDNVSVIEITDDTNLPRINYEGFSYQDALGSELVVNGAFSSDTAWSLNNGATISDGKANIVGDGTAFTYISQGGVFTSGKQYIVKLDVIINSGLGLKFQDGANNENIGFATTSGTYTFNFTATSNSNILIARRTGGTPFNSSVDNVSVKEYLGQEVVPDSGCGSWLFEPQSTNLITQSELFSDASWTKLDTIVTNGVVSPSGNASAFNLLNDNSTNQAYTNVNIAVTATNNYTFSAFIKKGNVRYVALVNLNPFTLTYFDLENGIALGSTSISSSIKDYGNGWFRCSVETIADTTTKFCGIYLSENGTSLVAAAIPNGDGIKIWGAQLEEQSYATSYIPTEGSTVTRNQDLCNNGGSLASINSAEGVLYAEIAALASDGETKRLAISDGSNNNRVFIGYNAANTIQFVIQSSGVIIVNSTFSVSDITQFSKIALKYKENDCSFWIDGVEVGTDTTAAMPTGLNQLLFGQGDPSRPLFGKTKAVAVWKEALSDQELADLTYPTPTDPTFALDFDTIATDFTFARGSEATYVDAQGLIQSTASNNAPRLDYSTGAEAFLLEPQSTNLVTESELFGDAYWTKSGVTLTSGQVSPSGDNTAYKLDFSANNDYIQAGVSGLNTSEEYTLSFYAKVQLGTATIQSGNINGGVYETFTVTDQWQRFEVTQIPSDTTRFPRPIRSNGSDEVYLWGAQIEQQSYATSYIPTSGTTVTRNQETCINATPEINSEEGVLYAEIAALSDDGTSRRITLLESLNNKVSLILSSTSNSIQGLVVSGGSVQFNETFATLNTLDFNKIAVSYAENNFALWVNGVKVRTDTSGNTPIGLSELSFADGDNTSNKFFGNTKDVQVYTKALSDAELIKLTT